MLLMALWLGCDAGEKYDSTMMDGGPCTYTEIHGTCTFTNVTADQEVAFHFVSDDGAMQEDDIVVIGDGAPPTQACIDAWNIAQDQAVGCTFLSIESGTCSPTGIRFDDFEVDRCE